jgi:hypothetical protein
MVLLIPLMYLLGCAGIIFGAIHQVNLGHTHTLGRAFIFAISMAFAFILWAIFCAWLSERKPASS